MVQPLVQGQYSHRVTEAFQRVSDLDQYTATDLASPQWAVSVTPGTTQAQVAAQLGVPANRLFSTNYLRDTYVFNVGGAGQPSAAGVINALNNYPRAQYFFPLTPVDYQKFSVPNDPYLADQWHLINFGQVPGGIAGEDANILDAWRRYDGSGVVVGILDDSLQWNHPDLLPNYRPDLSFDFVLQDNDPSPFEPEDFHGTAVAGIAVGAGNNRVGISGAAYNADLAGLRMLGPQANDFKISQALSHRSDAIDVYNNSWGLALPTYDTSGPFSTAALEQGAQLGRNGRGSVFVFSAGNDRQFLDNTNYSPFTNSIFTTTIGAVDHRGQIAAYSTPGASVFAVSQSQGDFGFPGIVTTDLVGADGYNGPGVSDFSEDPFPDLDYTSTFSGTSASAPLASGIIALMLDANPNLSYRDIQHIIAATARKVAPNDPDWQLNGKGYDVNHDFGFGAIDASAAVRMAEVWSPVSEMRSLTVAGINVGEDLGTPDQAGVAFNLLVDTATADRTFALEWIELQFSAEHRRPSDLEILLVSPSNTVARLAETHFGFVLPENNADFNWTYSTNHFWGENIPGEWRIVVTDRNNSLIDIGDPADPMDDVLSDGTWQNFSLIFHGTTQAIPIPPVAPAPSGAIIGTVFNDRNLDAQRGNSEEGLGGRVVFLDANNNGILDPNEASTVTGESGLYSFTRLSAGMYSVVLQCNDGFQQTAPINGQPQLVTIGANQRAINVDFGTTFTGVNCSGQPSPGQNVGVISGMVFFDANNDNMQNGGEPIVNDVWVYVDMNDSCTIGALEPQARVRPDGTFTISNVPVGTHRLRVTPSATYSIDRCDFLTVTIGDGLSGQASITGVMFGVGPGMPSDPNGSGSSASGVDWGESNAVTHGIIPSLRLGNIVIADPAPPDARNDNDGVFFTTGLERGRTETITVIAHQPNSARGFLQGWIDFNGNGVLEPSEQVFRNLRLNAGNNQLTVTVPNNAAQSDNILARFRWGWEINIGPTGPAMAGEVEDYRVSIPMMPDRDVRANDDMFMVEQGSVGNVFNVLANDTSRDGGSLTIIAVSTPANGNATIIPANGTTLQQIQYTPNVTFFGTDTFTYTIRNQAGQTDSATVTVEVLRVNQPPVAGDDSFVVTAGSLNNFLDVLANDFDPDGDLIHVVGLTQPTNGGVATFTANGVVFTPFPDFTGTAALQYTISDGVLTDTATVTINVVAGPSDALVQFRLAITDENGNVLTSAAVGQEFLLNVFVQDLRNAPQGVFSAYLDVLYNSTLVMPDGNITYGPAYPAAQSGSLATVGLIDEAGATDGITPLGPSELLLWQLPMVGMAAGTADFTGDPADVLPLHETTLFLRNEPVPSALQQFLNASLEIVTELFARDDTFTVEEDSGPNTLDVLANDVFAPGTGPLTLVSVTTPGNGTAAIVNNQVVYRPNDNFSGTDMFMYTVRDNTGAEATATVTVNVTPINDAPVAVDDSFTVAQGSANNVLNVLANDSDPDGDVLMLANVSQPTSGGTALIIGNNVIYTPPANFTGTDTFDYTVSDGELTDTATVTISVEPTDALVRFRMAVTDGDGNELPAIGVGQDFFLNVFVLDLRDEPFGVFSAYLDVEYDAALASVTGPIIFGAAYTAGQSGDTSTPGLIDEAGATDGINPLGPDEQLLWRVPMVSDGPGMLVFAGNPADVLPIHETVLFLRNDPVPASLQVFFNAGVTIVDITEVMAVDDMFSVPQDSVDNSLDVLANDVAPPANLPLTIVNVTTPTNGTAVIAGNRIEYTPNAGFLGSDTFEYTIEDSTGAQSTATVTVAVGQIVEYELEITDTNGAPIDTIATGQVFQLMVFTRDLRAEPTGVFAGYLDVLVNGAGSAVVTGPIVYGQLYPNGQSGDTSSPDIIDELGAFDEFGSGFEPNRGERKLLAIVTYTATSAGEISFAGDPADNVPLHFTLVFNMDNPIDPGSILYGMDSITIVEGLTMSPFFNVQNAFDVDGNGVVSPMDALIVVNDLAINGPRSLRGQSVLRNVGAPMMIDVNNDFFLSPMDALWVINAISLSTPMAAMSQTVTSSVGDSRIEPLAPVPEEASPSLLLPSPAGTALPAGVPGANGSGSTLLRTGGVSPQLADAAFDDGQDDYAMDWENTILQVAHGRDHS